VPGGSETANKLTSVTAFVIAGNSCFWSIVLDDSDKYICAFRGRRDYYQVPVALAEGDLLDEFITDAYAGPVLRSLAGMAPKRLQEKIRARCEPNLPENRVKCEWKSAVFEHLKNRLGVSPSLTFAKIDRQFALAVEARARQRKSNLLVYSHYAWEPFTARYGHTPKKVLFQFHPHAETERRILLDDCVTHPFVRQSFEEEVGERVSGDLKRRGMDSWKHADLILCASSFTRRSLLEAGAEPGRCKVVPYGIDVMESERALAASDRFTAIFVGTGCQRKGLHHVLLAWQKAALPSGSGLILVCRSIDATLARLAQATQNVRLIRGVGVEQLKELFAISSLFVMPSLVEGFGQVYLEALASGCPVLGTSNSGLPDLCNGADPVWQIEPGNIDELVSKLESLSRTLPGVLDIRQRAQACASRHCWSHFRAGIRFALESG
jgi:glycosyltransferase involved in cell wall biosynthesis